MTRVISTPLMKLIVVLASVLFLAACSEPAPESKFKLGEHYLDYSEMYDDALKSQAGLESPDIIEFFSYGCHHCMEFAPKLQAWHGKNKDKKIAYVPVVWNETTELYARLYHLVNESGLSPEKIDHIHHELFGIVHGFGRTSTLEEQRVELIAYLETQGIEPIASVNGLTKSDLDSSIATSLMLTKRFEVSGTPTLIISEKYKVNNRSLNSKDEMLMIVNEVLGL